MRSRRSQGVEDGIGSDETRRQSLDIAMTFIRETGVDVFAPSIGNAHGVYSATPDLDSQRVTDLVAATDMPIALHGGSGMTDAQFHDLISRGCAKVNISTALKIEFMKSNLAFLRGAEDQGQVGSAVAVHARCGSTSSTWRPDRGHIRQRRQGVVSMPFLIFDCDGVLADTERNGHLPAFNQTFAEFGVPVQWSDADYAVKVLIGGGKERMASLLTPEFVAGPGCPPTRRASASSSRTGTSARPRSTPTWCSGRLPARPGIARIVEEADAAGWGLAVASTSAEPSVRAVLEHAVGRDRARSGSPSSPATSCRARSLRPTSTCSPSKSSVATPDDRGGRGQRQRAARQPVAAGLRTLVTVSGYTSDEDFPGASLVVSSARR